MSCSNCNTVLESDAKFCPNCGRPTELAFQYLNRKPVPQEEPTTPPAMQPIIDQSAATVEAAPKKTKRLLKTVSAAVAGIAVIGVGIASGMFFIQSPKEQYFLSEYKSVNAILEEYTGQYADELQFNKLLLESPSSNNSKINGNIAIADGSGDLSMLQEIFNQSTIVMKKETDPSKSASVSTVTIETHDDTKLDVSLYQSRDQVAVKFPFINDKFHYFNLDQYGEFMRTIDPNYKGPDTVKLNDFTLQELILSEADKKAIKKRYYQYLNQALKDDYFSLKKEVSYKHDGKTLKLREITLKMSPKQTEAFINGLVDEMIADKKLHSLIAKRALALNEVALLSKNNALLSEQADLEKEIRTALTDLKKSLKTVEYPKGLKSTILINDDKQIIERKLKLEIVNQDEGSTIELVTKNVPVGKKESYRTINLEMKPKDEHGEKLAFSFTNELEQQKAKRSEKIAAKFILQDAERVIADYKLNLKMATNDPDSSKQGIVYDFAVLLAGDSLDGTTPNISGKIEHNKDTNLNKRYSNHKWIFNVNMKDEVFGAKLVFTLDSKTKLTDKVDLVEISKKNGKNITKLTEAERAKLMVELENTLFSLYEAAGITYN